MWIYARAKQGIWVPDPEGGGGQSTHKPYICIIHIIATFMRFSRHLQFATATFIRYIHACGCTHGHVSMANVLMADEGRQAILASPHLFTSSEPSVPVPKSPSSPSSEPRAEDMWAFGVLIAQAHFGDALQFAEDGAPFYSPGSDGCVESDGSSSAIDGAEGGHSGASSAGHSEDASHHRISHDDVTEATETPPPYYSFSSASVVSSLPLCCPLPPDEDPHGALGTLLCGLLDPSPALRPTATEALRSDYFARTPQMARWWSRVQELRATLQDWARLRDAVRTCAQDIRRYHSDRARQISEGAAARRQALAVSERHCPLNSADGWWLEDVRPVYDRMDERWVRKGARDRELAEDGVRLQELHVQHCAALRRLEQVQHELLLDLAELDGVHVAPRYWTYPHLPDGHQFVEVTDCYREQVRRRARDRSF